MVGTNATRLANRPLQIKIEHERNFFSLEKRDNAVDRRFNQMRPEMKKKGPASYQTTLVFFDLKKI